jgi:hypothetical protein
MEAFRIDFSMQRGHEMLVSREPDLLRDELDEIDITMLQLHHAPKLLPVDWLEMDGRVTFRYSIDGRKMLSQRLQIQSIGMNEYYSLLLGVVDILDDCKPYMLREECCLLHENYLFVGDDWGDLQAAYLPLKSSAGRKPAEEALLSLAVRWVTRVSQVDGAGLQRILRHLESGGSWQALRAELLGLLSGSAAAAVCPAGPVMKHPSEAEASRSSGGRWQVAPREQTDPLSEDKAKPDDADFFMDIEPGFAENFEPADGLAKRRWILGAGTVTIVAIIWRFIYFAEPSRKHLLLSGGLTAAAAWTLLLIWRKLTGGRLMHPNGEEAAGIAGMEQGQDSWDWRESYPEPEPQEREARGAGSIRPYRHGKRETVLAVADTVGGKQRSNAAVTGAAAGRDETVALLPHPKSISPGKEAELLCSLQREWNGATEQVTVRNGVTVIGRSEEAADYRDGADGLSRAHMEVLRSGIHVEIRDLGSRNGSQLNGQTMIPYKYYEIQAGDRIQLAGSSGPWYVYGEE